MVTLPTLMIILMYTGVIHFYIREQFSILYTDLIILIQVFIDLMALEIVFGWAVIHGEQPGQVGDLVLV